MGVASGDLNRDGLLDLHVTNFRNEPVNLFIQSESGTFMDLAARFDPLVHRLAGNHLVQHGLSIASLA